MLEQISTSSGGGGEGGGGFQSVMDITGPLDCTSVKERYMLENMDSFRPEWYILTICHCRDISFWSEILEYYIICIPLP